MKNNLYFFTILLAANLSEAQPAIKNTSSTAGIVDVINQNKSGQKNALSNAIQLAQSSANKYEHGSECALSCPVGCCAASDNLVLQGGVDMFFNGQETIRANSHYVSGMQACVMYNQMSINQKNCAAEIQSTTATVPDKTWYDSNGLCKAGAPRDCTILSTVPGGNIFNDPMVNCEKTGQCKKDFYSTYQRNADGSLDVKLKNKSVHLSKESFKDKNSLIAAGVPSQMAEKLLANYNKIVNALNIQVNQYTVLAQTKKVVPGVTIGTKANLVAITPPSAMQKPAPVFDPRANFDKLTINYNGEAIHIAQSNIFTVVTMRYRASADTFFLADK